MAVGKKIVNKCINCNGNFKSRWNTDHWNVTNDLIKHGRGPSGLKLKDLYKGNEIPYHFKETKHYDFDHKLETGEIKYTGESGYSWKTWDGETYRTTASSMYFCSGQCEKQFGSDCARARIRRIGSTLVRFEKNDRRLS